MKLEIRPETLIAKIAEMPYSGPTVETFHNFVDRRTYQVEIGDLGHDQIYFGVSARPWGRLSGSMDLVLSFNPLGPMVELLVSRREREGGARLPRLHYQTGWEFVTYDPEYPNCVVLRFQRSLRTGGSFDPISLEGQWILDVMQHFNRATNRRYFAQGEVNPDPRVLTHDQYDEEWTQASQRFLAALG